MKQGQKKMKTYSKRLEQDLDEICKWIRFVLQGGRDAYDGKPLEINFQPHHFIHRHNKSLRWDLANIFDLNQSNHFWIHTGGEGLFGAAMQQKHPERIEYLREQQHKTKRFRKTDMEAIYNQLKYEFKEIFDIPFEKFKELGIEEKYRIALQHLISEQGG